MVGFERHDPVEILLRQPLASLIMTLTSIP